MKYNFDEKHNRLHTNCVKWENNDCILPMWVADMDFTTAPFIIDSVVEKAQKGIYGYSYIPEDFFKVYQSWWDRRHHIKFDTRYMLFSPGVIAGITAIIRALTNEGDSILIQSPVYNCFYRKISDTNRKIISSDLIYQNGEYEIDFNDLAQKLALKTTKMMILCNPHNPIGKAWSFDELKQIGDLCQKNHVFVIADEIHCDFVEPNYHYIPFMSVNKNFNDFSITCVSTSKTFNLAGLQSSCIIAENAYLYEKISHQIDIDEISSVNCFAVEATIAALTNGDEWVDELNIYIANNKRYVVNFIAEQQLHLHVVPSNSTYLMWIDVSYYTDDADLFCEYLIKSVGLKLCSGRMYGENGKTFVRMNIATPINNVIDGMNRFYKAIKSYQE